MKNVKHLSDLTDLNHEELEKAYKRFEPAIKLTNFTNLNFWIGALILGVIGFFYFTKEQLGNYQIDFLFLVVVSAYYLGDKLSYKKGFLEGYEAGWSDGVKECIKYERGLSDKEFEVIEDMDISSKYGI